jgi:putative transposase
MPVLTLSHKIQLDPTCRQANYFAKACGVSRFTWNHALAEWQRQYESGKKPNALSLKKQFNAIKKSQFPWMYEVTKYASQQPFIFLQNAFNRFFKKQSQYPRFKKKGIHDSFYIGNDHIKVEGKRIKIPKLGWVRLRESLRFGGKIISATVSRVAHKWFVSLNVEITNLPPPCESQASVGVDLGISTLATLFDGHHAEKITGPKPLRRLTTKLRRAQRRLSHKQKGSRNRLKQRLLVAKVHARIRNLRQDSLHKLTTQLVQNYQRIVLEDLNVKGMMRNHRLARAISDMGFYEFRRQLEYKSMLYGNHVEVVDRFYPSSKKCSRCGEVKETLSLSERTYDCKHCQLKIDRDDNAARNLYFSTVSSTGFQACGEEGAGSVQSH